MSNFYGFEATKTLILIQKGNHLFMSLKYFFMIALVGAIATNSMANVVCTDVASHSPNRNFCSSWSNHVYCANVVGNSQVGYYCDRWSNNVYCTNSIVLPGGISCDRWSNGALCANYLIGIQSGLFCNVWTNGSFCASFGGNAQSGFFCNSWTEDGPFAKNLKKVKD